MLQKKEAARKKKYVWSAHRAKIDFPAWLSLSLHLFETQPLRDPSPMLLLFPSTERLSMSSLIPAGESALLRYSPVAANPNPLFLSPCSRIREIQKSKANTYMQPPAGHSYQKEILWYLLSISDRMSRASSCTDTSSCLPMAPVSWAVIFLHTFAVMVEPAREIFFPTVS